MSDSAPFSPRLRRSVEPATRLARLRSDLARAAGPRLGSVEAPAFATAGRRLVGCQRHGSVLQVKTP
jgi:hypothetical protein